jgi:integrative and conjugative element protein (TIGR02256 family)
MILRSGIRLVEIADLVVKTIEGFSRGVEMDKEAGGVLIGAYRGPHVEIIHCTTPMASDLRLRNLFDRKDVGHRSEVFRHWRDSGRTLTFVGEWHTHPERLPSPSFIDKMTWRRISARQKIGPLVFVIRGTSGWWCGLMNQNVLSSLTPLDQYTNRSMERP